jgi:glucose/arabinose dehydrogenase
MRLRPLLLPLCLAGTFAHATDFPLLNTSAPASAYVPTSADAGLVWNQEADPANIDSWLTGTTGIGYDTATGTGGNYIPHIGINVQSGMSGINGTVYARIKFSVSAAQRPLFRTLMLRMRYDDGFVAWINGTRVAAFNDPATLTWNSLATQDHAADLTGWEDFDITQHLNLLHDGENTLAIQGLNSGINSSDVLIVPTLVATDIAPPRWPAPAFTEVPGVGQRTRPVAIRNAGDGSGKLYIVEQRGVISVLSGTTLSTFLDINARVRGNNDGGNEEGLHGLAFPPGFAQSRRFYVTYNNFNTTVATPTAPSVPAGSLVLSRFTTQAANPALADPNSEQIILTIPHPTNTNHNGGDIHFAKDGLLYWGTGDGGSGGDPPNNAQNPNSLLGKMLRLDVEAHAGGGALIPASNPWAAAGDGVADAIYHLGLRNPWRWSFDRSTGDLWIGDVGQDAYEEISFASGNSPGLNFQWKRMEALHNYSTSTGYGPGIVTEPLIEKPRTDISITGGFVYRGPAFPRLNGIYFFGDYGSGRFYGAQKDLNGAWRNTTFTTPTPSITTFGEDETGELYWANGSTGRVYRITDSGSDSAYLSIVTHSISPAGRLTFTWGAASDRSYVPEVSTDLVTWTPAGPEQAGNATFRLTFSETADPPAGTGRRYFRAREL